MELTRRNFLKGLMGLAGVAAIGLPSVATDDLIEEVEQFLKAGGEPERPTGPFGSIRIGDNWYALYGASVDMMVEPTEMTVLGDVWRRYAPRQRGWRIECELDTCEGISIFDSSPREIEFDMHRATFGGEAVLTSVAPSIGYDNAVRYYMGMEGVGPLNYVASA